MESLLASLLSLDDRAAIVAGAGSGTGEAIAHLLAAAGARVVVADADLDAAARVASEIAMLDHHAEAFRADVADPASAAELVAAATRSTGRLDLLVVDIPPAAGPASIVDHAIEDWRRSLSEGLDGLFCCAKAAAAHWAEVGGSGAIVPVVPLDRAAGPGIAQGGVSAAVAQLTRALAVDLAPRVRVNGVAVGPLTAPGQDAGGPPPEGGEEIRRPARHVPMGHAGLPADVAKAVLFLCSELSSHITGQTLIVDGGWSLT